MLPSSDTDLSGTWSKISSVLSRELSEQSYKTWFENVWLLKADASSITLRVPDSYYGKWLEDHYQNLILSSAAEILGRPVSVSYQVVAAQSVTTSTPSVSAPPREKGPGTISLNSAYTFDNFVIGPGNRFAHAAAMAVTDAPARQYNPLFIYGPTGLGKTHLLQSIACEISRKNSHFKILYISSEQFTNQLINAIQTRTTHQFRAKYRTLDLLLIDDIHSIAGRDSTQEEFFNTFNSLYDAHKQIVVTSDRPPKEIPSLEERLVSRFGWGLVTDIQPPDFETRVAILKKKIEKETVLVPDDVLYFIAGKIKSNIRELEGALIRVVAYCTLTRTALDVRLTQDILKDAVKEEAQKFSIEEIQKTVADYFQIKVSDLRAKKRTLSVVRPRQIAMYLIRELTGHSLPEIGEFFGGKDHTTVLHACNKISREKEKDIGLRGILDKITSLLRKEG
ncbi:MAG TPA: chromosomal replication initiator protein DnaA [Candidatus Omnitrophota bacterium]|jgi:chromosomal replication initiator protein|nr:MAG: Chromosomal replication initiator protein DnaA [Candidatus Omnitrophica bacterium ADurb.Bin314]HQB94165.1 chromosomal replication initiator protein DnaA [Candidatus Omnitrophota bacterium]